MASVYDLKPAFQRLLRPLVGALAGAGATANQVTVAALLLSLATGAALVLYPQQRWILLLVPAVLFVRMALNAIDGMLAREHRMASRLGAVLNELGDVVSDSALYLPLALVFPAPPWLVIGIVLAAVIGEMTGVVAVQIGAARRYDGPMGKSDRAAVFGLLCLLLGLGVPAGAWLSYGLGAVLVLSCLTIVNRARKALKEALDASD
ncbi:MAG: CDP-alcohol phosphatidyltransferase family protein [Inquilinus sp.]|nr:CDP-alcohol phosphatidyltransferase family protein [Inquilinus sp.]